MSFSSVDPNEAVVIRELPDQPSNQGFRAEELKLQFDTGAANLVRAVNNLINALNSATAAQNLGFSSTDGVQASNVQAAIEAVQAQLVDISQGGVADGAITTEKVANEAITGAKIAKDTLLEDVTSAVNLLVVDTTNRLSIENGLKFYYSKALGIVLVKGVLWMTIAAAGSNYVVFRFRGYEPNADEDGAGLVNASLISEHRLMISRNCDSADIGQTYGINISGWYFCDGA